jgi:hypothetical protein
VRQPIDEAIRQLEVELSLLKNRLPNRGSENSGSHARGQSRGIARTVLSNLQPGLIATSPSPTRPTKTNVER